MDFATLENIIRAQQKGKEALPEFTVGEQLLDMARHQPEIAELLAQDLAVKEMDLTAAAAQLKKYADENHKGAKCYCITPMVAERILREFYHLPEEDQSGERRAESGEKAPIVNLADFL